MVTEKKRSKASSPREPEYIIDKRGRKKAVILPIREYERLIEDLYDRNLIEEARGEPSETLEEVEKQFRKDGLL